MIRARKTLLGAFGAGAAVIVLGTSAYACVPFKGDLQVTGTTSGNLVTGDGTTASHGYCTGRNPTSAGTASYNTSITVTVDAATACTGSGNQLATGNNDVILNNASTDAAVPFTYDGTKWNFVNGTGCFFSTPPAGNIFLTSSTNLFTVDSTGSASKSFTLPHMNRVDPTNMASSLCVGKSGGSGIFAPIRITSI